MNHVPQFVDLAFRLRGTELPVDHGYLLFAAISRRLAALHEASDWGVHPVRGTPLAPGRATSSSMRQRSARSRRGTPTRSLTGPRFTQRATNTRSPSHLKPWRIARAPSMRWRVFATFTGWQVTTAAISTISRPTQLCCAGRTTRLLGSCTALSRMSLVRSPPIRSCRAFARGTSMAAKSWSGVPQLLRCGIVSLPRASPAPRA